MTMETIHSAPVRFMKPIAGPTTERPTPSMNATCVAAKRKADTETMLQKESEKASTEEALEAEKENHADLTKELLATAEYLASVHGDCDWLLKFFDVRKQARAGEVDALEKAKAVLSGADYSLLQSNHAIFLAP